MEREIEVKLLGLDVKKIEKKLISLGAKLIAKEEQKNIRIDSKSNPIDEKKGYLRIRSTKDLLENKLNTYFTFKEQISNEGVRENLEHTISIDSKEELINILKCLGYDIYDTGYKYRVSYIYKEARFDFDFWDENTYPYPFIEIEASSEERLYSLIDELEIDRSAVSTLSISQLKNSLQK